MLWCSAALLCACAASGCGNGFKTVAVGGRVTLDGKPVADAGVLFTPDRKGPTAAARTAADGTFTLKTGKLDGAAPGVYRVAIQKEEVVGNQVDAKGEEIADARTTIKHGVPARYADPATSGLTLEIKEATTDADFSLTSKAAEDDTK
ncbi:MAG: carboxypeptidase-like regulatory domain-containing protein [Pirellulales bacterium]